MAHDTFSAPISPRQTGARPLAAQAARATPEQPAIRAGWVRHLDELRDAQRLRHRVFAQEMGATLDTPLPGFDIDPFDDFCEHLIVRDLHTNCVIGTYRVLTPEQARQAGGFYTDREFDLSPLTAWREECVEMGRSCVDANWRNGSVILALWRELAAFMASRRLPRMIGCASIPMNWPGVHRHGAAAATIWEQLQGSLVPVTQRIRPHHPLPVEALLTEPLQTVVSPPPLLRGYLKLGAMLMGPPAWDAQFNTADLPIHLHIDDLAPRYRRLLGLSN